MSEQPPEPDPQDVAPGPPEPILEVRDLRKSFPRPGAEPLVVLDVPWFELAAEEQVALEGGSGTGKTTFLHCLAGILAPDSGSLRLVDQELVGMPEAARDRLRARVLGYVFQSFHLLPGLSALENVELGMAFGKGRDRPQAERLLEEVGLADRRHHRPAELSVGQRQRVALARALANQPRVVLADEPTGSLDRRSAGAALELIRRTCAEHGAALLLVSHDPEVLGSFEDRRSLAELNRAAAAHDPEEAAA